MALSATVQTLATAVADTLVREGVVAAAVKKYRPQLERGDLDSPPRAWVVPGPIGWARSARALSEVEPSVDIAIRARMDTATGIDDAVADEVLDTAETVADTLYRIAVAKDGDPDPVPVAASVLRVEIVEPLVGEEIEEHKVATSVVRVVFRVHR